MDEGADRAKRTYDAASDSYDAAPLGFWDRTGRRTVERLGLPAGARVLDVPCGAGASAFGTSSSGTPTCARSGRGRARSGMRSAGCGPTSSGPTSRGPCWTRPRALCGLFADADIAGAEAELVLDEQPLREPDDFWTIAIGSGYRHTTDALSGPERARVHEQVVEALAGVAAVGTSAIHGVAHRR